MTRLVSKVQPNGLLVCHTCARYKLARDFPTRFKNHPTQKENYMPRCKSCQAVGNSLRKKVNGKLVFPTASELRAAVQGGAVHIPTKLKSANHPRTPRKTGAKLSAKGAQIANLRRAIRELEAAEKAENAGVPGVVYLIGEEPTMLTGTQTTNGVRFSALAVKIGYASRSANERLRALQTGNPRKLVLIGTIEGTPEDEAALHQEFHHHNVLQEWFRPTPALLSRFTNKEV